MAGRFVRILSKSVYQLSSKKNSSDLSVIAAWAAQLLDAEAAAQLAVYLHGLAGDLAEADESDVSLVATDVIGRLGDAVAELTARRRQKPA